MALTRRQHALLERSVRSTVPDTVTVHTRHLATNTGRSVSAIIAEVQAAHLAGG